MKVPFSAVAVLATCLFAVTATAQPQPSFVQARKGFETKLLRSERAGGAAPEPADPDLILVSYRAPLGDNAAYVSTAPDDDKRHPAIIWLTGGFSNSIGPLAWTPGPKNNDQSAMQLRKQGVVTMYPSLRGGNANSGSIETFCGEIDDVLAAADFLASLDYVDPKRIYLGGHSTGGTLALLVAAASGNRFRAVFAFGPVEDVANYGPAVLPFDLSDRRELRLRAPQEWLNDIRCPTYIFEGTQNPCNITSLRALQSKSTNPQVYFRAVPNQTHFSLIAPLLPRLAASILADEDTAAPFKLK